ncbi:MAG: FkbM family methyltransferase [Ilumatobacteraceae bacterium]
MSKLMFVSYAQNGEDVVLHRVLRDIDEGRYVDVGAADPTWFSVTKAFYDRGWSGLNIEPSPRLAEQLASERPRDTTWQGAAADYEGESIFHVVADTGLSTMYGEGLGEEVVENFGTEKIVVPVRSLNSLLDEGGWAADGIHFLKVDVEGAERDVLAGIDLGRWRPWIIVVEATAQLSTKPTHHEWEHLLLDCGYQFCLFDGLNRFYLADERAELAERLSYPAGVFDQPYRSASIEQILVENEAAERSALEGRIALAQAEVSDVRARLEAATARSAGYDALVAEYERVQSALTLMTNDAVVWRNELIRLRVVLGNVQDEQRRADVAVAAARAGLDEATARAAEYEDAYRRALTEIDAIANTVSWRVTKPLRVVRRAARRHSPGQATVVHEVSTAPRAASRVEDLAMDVLDGFRRRLALICALLDGDAPELGTESHASALLRLEQAVDSTELTPATVGWLACTAVSGAYPTESEWLRASRVVRRDGGRGVVAMLLELLVQEVDEGRHTPAELELIEDQVLVDVSHTATYDLHTGIQRVVREVAGRFLQRDGVSVVQWNLQANSVTRLARVEEERFMFWRRYAHSTGAKIAARPLEECTGKTVIPWNCVVLLPELIDTTARCSGYRALCRSGVIRRFSMIGYDLIPMTASETVTDGMTANFGQYLALVKYATRVSAISSSAAEEFRSFGRMLASQGLSGPEVFADPLPTDIQPVNDADLAAARRDLDLGSMPVVLVVGSHEPRKNHVVVLEAADRLWASGVSFELIFAGGSSWGLTEFGSYIDDLQRAARPVRVLERVDETTLWSLYRLARFTMFPSLIEGYGLPITESLVCGTPVITSNFGSMLEIAEGGGALAVDSRDSVLVEQAMRTLLEDQPEYDRLAAQAAARTFPSWTQYTERLWDELVGDAD